MYAHKMEIRINADHRLIIDLPPSFPVGDAEIIVLSKPGEPAGETLTEFLDWLKSQDSSGRSKADIDARIAEERASWSDDRC